MDLISLFDKASESPEFIPKLRQLILDLAVRGKLVPQNPKDEPASELLKKIKAEKDKLVKEGKIRPDKPLPPITPDEIPFEIPKNWECTRFKTITHDWGQKIPDSDITYIDVSSIDNKNGIILSPKILSSDEAPSRARKIVKKGTIIYSCVRPYLLNIALINEDYTPSPIASTAFAILHPLNGGLNGRYLWLFLRSPLMINYVEGLMRGQAYPAINDRDFFQIPFPLPPLPEQKRIVAKVDELMSLCDELEAVHGVRDEKRERLNLASLKAVTDARTPEDFKNASSFFINHLTEITVTQDHIKNLRQTILDLAVRGKLVSQNPKDEPASELLKRIHVEKERMLKAGEIKKIEKFEPIKSDEISFTVPSGWQIIRMGWLARKLGAGSTPLGGKSVYLDEGIPFLRSQNVHNDGLRIDDVALISLETHNRMSGTHVQKNDILLNITGASIGRCALVPSTFAEGNVSQHVAIIRLFLPEIREFIHLSLISPFFQKLIDDVQVGVSREGLSMQSLRIFPMVLPPLTEQKRIVAKVDELMSLCDALESQISITSTQSTRLLNALLQEGLF